MKRDLDVKLVQQQHLIHKTEPNRGGDNGGKPPRRLPEYF